MQMKRMEVTPELAKSWLETANGNNRTMTRRVVQKYADDMRNGRWLDTHQNAIAFYEDGDLADGQHRLAAVISANIAVSMFVGTGLDRSAAGAIDQGRPRSTADAIIIGGLSPLGKYVSEAVAMVRLIDEAERGLQTVMSAQKIAGYIGRVSDLVSYASSSLSTARGGIKNTPVRAAVAVGSKFVDRIVMDRFCRVLISGMPEGGNDGTIITLRNRLLTGVHQKAGRTRVVDHKMVLRFIKAYDQGVTLTKAIAPTELAYRLGAFDEK